MEQAYKSVEEVINHDARMSLSDIIDLLNGIKDLKLYNVKREALNKLVKETKHKIKVVG